MHKPSVPLGTRLSQLAFIDNTGNFHCWSIVIMYNAREICDKCTDEIFLNIILSQSKKTVSEYLCLWWKV